MSLSTKRAKIGVPLRICRGFASEIPAAHSACSPGRFTSAPPPAGRPSEQCSSTIIRHPDGRPTTARRSGSRRAGARRLRDPILIREASHQRQQTDRTRKLRTERARAAKRPSQWVLTRCRGAGCSMLALRTVEPVVSGGVRVSDSAYDHPNHQPTPSRLPPRAPGGWLTSTITAVEALQERHGAQAPGPGSPGTFRLSRRDFFQHRGAQGRRLPTPLQVCLVTRGRDACHALPSSS